MTMLPVEMPIERQRVVCLEGGKYQTADVAYGLASQEMALGKRVYWVDGGSLLDPTRIISSSQRRSMDYLDRLHACRAFTAHQMSEIFRSMEHPGDLGTPPEQGSLLIVTNIHSMFLDVQLGVVERNMLLRNTLQRLRRMSRASNLAVFMTIDRRTVPPTPTKIRNLLKETSDYFLKLSESSEEKKPPVRSRRTLRDYR